MNLGYDDKINDEMAALWLSHGKNVKIKDRKCELIQKIQERRCRLFEFMGNN